MAELGNVRRFYILTGSSSYTYTWLEGEQSNSVNLNDNLIEVSDKSTEWQQFISGVKGGTISGTVHTNDDSSGPQYKFLTALTGGSTVTVFVGKLSSTIPSQGIVATCRVSSISDTNDNGSVASRQISLTITGEPTIYPTS